MAPVRLSPQEIVSLIARLLFVFPFTAAKYFITATPRNKRSGHLPTAHFIQSGLFRVILNVLQPRQMQFLLPPTVKQYKLWLSAKRRQLTSSTSPSDKAILSVLTPRVDQLWDDGKKEGSICWLGDPEKATKFVLQFHGGGFVVPLHKGHMEWSYHAYILPSIKEGAAPDVAVAVLEYSMCPGATYPTQVEQSIQSLVLVLNIMRRRGIDPSTSLIMGGDSAGGNLALLTLRHLITPHPGIDPITTAPLAGVFLVSPFVDDRTTSASWQENGDFDMITSSFLTRVVDQMLQPHEGIAILGDKDAMTKLAAPLRGDMSSWLPELQKGVRSLYVTAGMLETFRDQVVGLVEEVKTHCPGLEVRFDLQKAEVHDYIFVEGASKKFGDATRRMVDWAFQALKS